MLSPFKNKPLRHWAHLLGACALVATLSACGGGGDDAAQPAPATPATPAPATNPSSGLTQEGNLNYLVTAADGSTRTVTATVAVSAANGTLTLALSPSPISVTTANSWANVNWPTGFSGALRAAGNAVLVCAAGDVSQVALSHNMTLVSNPVAALSGVTLRINECDNGAALGGNLLFNADGSATLNPGTADQEPLSAAEVSAYFNDAGFTEADGSNFKGRLYSIVIGGQTQYHLVFIGSEKQAGSPDSNFVLLASPQ